MAVVLSIRPIVDFLRIFFYLNLILIGWVQCCPNQSHLLHQEHEHPAADQGHEAPRPTPGIVFSTGVQRVRAV